MSNSILCLDVQYYEEGGKDKGHVAAGYATSHMDSKFTETIGLTINQVEPYEPGNFYKRELPCIQRALEKNTHAVDIIIIDGYVFLDDHNGLGYYVHELANRIYPASGIAVIGVAKTAYKGSDFAKKIYRGSSNSPLFITSKGG